jgi:hypothetical protein
MESAESLVSHGLGGLENDGGVFSELESPNIDKYVIIPRAEAIMVVELGKIGKRIEISTFG